MWYTAGDKDSRYKIGYATSRDGLAWQRENEGRPVLGPGREGKFDDQVVLHPAVVRDDAGLLHIWYNGVGPQEHFQVGHATSRDGVQWNRENDGEPVLTAGTVGGRREIYVYNVMVLLEQGLYRMWYSTALTVNEEGRYALHGNGIVYAESRDGTHWKRDDALPVAGGDAGSADAAGLGIEYARAAWDLFFRRYRPGPMHRQIRAWDVSKLGTEQRITLRLYCRLEAQAIESPDAEEPSPPLTFPHSTEGEVDITFGFVGERWVITSTNPALPRLDD